MLTKEEIKKIISVTDHTNLSPTATEADILKLCDEAETYGAASICVPPCHLKALSDYYRDTELCTVIGFPNGYSSRNIKILETLDAVMNGVTEIDMVINLGWVKEGKYDEVLEEINAVKEVGEGRIVKVIVETSLLTEEEKIRMCDIVSRSNADFIKTSTGFSSGGAVESDITLFKKHLSNDKKIKAAGGIKTFEQAQRLISLGADRIGSSSLVKLAADIL